MTIAACRVFPGIFGEFFVLIFSQQQRYDSCCCCSLDLDVGSHLSAMVDCSNHCLPGSAITPFKTYEHAFSPTSTR